MDLILTFIFWLIVFAILWWIVSAIPKPPGFPVWIIQVVFGLLALVLIFDLFAGGGHVYTIHLPR